MDAHLAHFRATAMALESRPATDSELQDLRAMLEVRGVAPVSDSVKKWSEAKTGRRTEGLWGFVAPFRAEKKKKPPRSGQQERPEGSEVNSQVDAASEENAAELMRSLGFKVESITVALEQTSF